MIKKILIFLTLVLSLNLLFAGNLYNHAINFNDFVNSCSEDINHWESSNSVCSFFNNWQVVNSEGISTSIDSIGYINLSSENILLENDNFISLNFDIIEGASGFMGIVLIENSTKYSNTMPNNIDLIMDTQTISIYQNNILSATYDIHTIKNPSGAEFSEGENMEIRLNKTHISLYVNNNLIFGPSLLYHDFEDLQFISFYSFDVGPGSNTNFENINIMQQGTLPNGGNNGNVQYTNLSSVTSTLPTIGNDIGGFLTNISSPFALWLLLFVIVSGVAGFFTSIIFLTKNNLKKK